MTRFDTDLASRGWALIAEGASMISLAYAAAEATTGSNQQPGAGVGVPPSSDPAPADLPPLKPQVDAGLGVCPIHGVHWTIKAAGTNAAGKSWDAFYKCSEKDESQPKGWCTQKPQKIWRDTHPIREGVAA